MQLSQIRQKTRPGQRQQRLKVLMQYMLDADFVMRVRLAEKVEVTPEAGFAFPALDFGLHGGEVAGHAEGLAVAEPDVVVGVAF